MAPPKVKVSFVKNSKDETESGQMSLAQDTMRIMRESLGNILCFRATSSAEMKRVPKILSRTQEAHDLIGSRVSLKVDPNKPKGVSLKIDKKKSEHKNVAQGGVTSQVSDVTPYETTKQVTNLSKKSLNICRASQTQDVTQQSPRRRSESKSSIQSRNSLLKPAKTYCDIYRNSIHQPRPDLPNISEGRDKKDGPSRSLLKKKSQGVKEEGNVRFSTTDDTLRHLQATESVDRSLSELKFKRSVHVYEFTEEQMKEIRRKGCIKLNVQVKPEEHINDIDIIIDRNQVVAVAKTANPSEIHKVDS